MWTIHAAADAIRQGQLSPVDLLATCLERIDRYEPRVRAWQVGVLRADRLQHLGFSFTLGVMSGITSESPAAAAGTALGLGIMKELWDVRHGDFDAMDVFADACGALGAAGATITLTR